MGSYSHFRQENSLDLLNYFSFKGNISHVIEKRSGDRCALFRIFRQERNYVTKLRKLVGAKKMLRDYDQLLTETVKLADVAVRTTGQLRSIKRGGPITDPGSLQRALDFLKNATDGSVFIAGHSSGLQLSLKPLNWAMDTYLELHPSKPDYEIVATYLRGVLDQLRTVVQSPQDAKPEDIDSVADFFDKLGDIVASFADKKLLRVSEAPFRS